MSNRQNRWNTLPVLPIPKRMLHSVYYSSIPPLLFLKIIKGMQPKLSWKYLIDHDSRCKNCISFIDIRNIMILHVRKRWFWSNMTIGFPQFYSLRYKQGLGISTASCGMRKTDHGISGYSVPKSIALTRGCSRFSWMNPSVTQRKESSK